MCASYELWFVESQYEDTDEVAEDDDRRDELNRIILEGDGYTEPVTYMHRKEIDPMFLRGRRCRPGWLPKNDDGGGYRMRGLRAVTWDGVMEEIFEALCNSNIEKDTGLGTRTLWYLPFGTPDWGASERTETYERGQNGRRKHTTRTGLRDLWTVCFGATPATPGASRQNGGEESPATPSSFSGHRAVWARAERSLRRWKPRGWNRWL